MAGSTTGLVGKNMRSSPKTPGPLGTNADAGDPRTPKWFVGDTPGPLGSKDHADPDAAMCQFRSNIGGIEQAPTLADQPEHFEFEDIEMMSVKSFEGMPDGAARKAWLLKKVGRYQRQFYESALAQRIPVQLLAAVVINELLDINLIDVVQERMASGGSVGMAQIQVDTAIKDSLIPEDAALRFSRALGMERVTIAGRLKVAQFAIDAAAREIRILLEQIKANPGSAWVKQFEFNAAKAGIGQQIYDGFARGTQRQKEAQLANMVTAAYNSPDIIVAKEPTKYDNATRHGQNGGIVAELLFIWRFFRPGCG